MLLYGAWGLSKWFDDVNTCYVLHIYHISTQLIAAISKWGKIIWKIPSSRSWQWNNTLQRPSDLSFTGLSWISLQKCTAPISTSFGLLELMTFKSASTVLIWMLTGYLANRPILRCRPCYATRIISTINYKMLGSGYEALSEAVNVRATALTSCYKFSLVFAQVLPWGTQVENLPSNMVCVFVVARLKLNCIFSTTAIISVL